MPPTRLQLELAPIVDRAPADARRRAQAFFRRLLDDLSAIPDDNPFWDSMQVSILSHSEGGWSFLYRFDGRTLLVYDVRRE